MHFGRVAQLEGISLALPPDPIRTERFLSLPREGATEFYIGCPIWSSKTWLGGLYPSGTSPKKFLWEYSRVFNSVEVNSIFYHPPDAKRVAEWRDETPEGFRFCPKVYRGITEGLHSPHLAQMIGQYCEAVSHFESRLGLTFAQFSEHFGPEQVHALERFLKAWPMTIPLAVELRHPGWFGENSLADPVINLLYKHRTATVITDTAGRRDVLHFSLTQPKVLIRFQGNEGHPKDAERIQEWGERIRKWQGHSIEEIYFFTHQPGDELIPETARVAVRAITGHTVEFPTRLAPQLEIF